MLQNLVPQIPHYDEYSWQNMKFFSLFPFPFTLSILTLILRILSAVHSVNWPLGLYIILFFFRIYLTWFGDTLLLVLNITACISPSLYKEYIVHSTNVTELNALCYHTWHFDISKMNKCFHQKSTNNFLTLHLTQKADLRCRDKVTCTHMWLHRLLLNMSTDLYDMFSHWHTVQLLMTGYSEHNMQHS